MRLLYILPHPDDESFGPGPVINKYISEGHEVHLLTLTKGGATKQRFRLNLSIQEMGEVRYKEMLDVKNVLNLTSMTVLDLVDGGLKEMDPREIEKIISDHILKIKPNVLLTYPVSGISGFYDHLVCHAVVKRVFLEIKEKHDWMKRLAFFGISEEAAAMNTFFSVKAFKPEEIDCIVHVKKQDIQTGQKALDCYVTYTEVIEGTRIKEMLLEVAPHEFYMESFHSPVNSLLHGL
jgi:N-acetylglucosamine malate deacetylase 2